MKQINRAFKSVSYWRSEKWELKYVVAHRGDSVRFKRNHSRAARRLGRILCQES
jgi:hypothetical protein